MSQPAETRANYCYRHPNRQSYVLCQRCGRTICGECQTPGPVGFTCPECMREQRASAPRTKPAFVARLKGMGPHAPIVTYAIIAVCIVVFILQSLPVIGTGVTNALQYAGVYSYPGTFEPWRMITTIFAHASILHIALNMYTLWIIGVMLEPLLGRARYLALFALSGLAGSVAVMLIANPLQPVVGASGAIFGLFGALFVIQRRLGGNSTQLLVLIIINLVISFIPAFGIAWQAHIGGLAGGLLVGAIFTETRPLSRRPLQIGLLILLAVILILISFWHVLVP
jgi:membrane associated rhomboid family serine protease